VTALVAMAAGCALIRMEAGPLPWALAAVALVPAHALATTLGRYHHTQGASLADCRSQGEVPWTGIGRELALLWVLQTLAASAALSQLAAAGAILSPVLGLDWRAALPAALIGFLALPGLELARATLGQKLERFYRFDGVVTVTPPPTEELGRLARLERWLSAQLYPPAMAAPPAVIEFLQAAHPLPEGLCPVCGDALGEVAQLACTRCRAPHHRDCFEFSEGCARYGCGGSACEDMSSSSISVAEG
jgi:hypothetical protein